MVKFRLKTPFIVQARDQILGGVWYKPTWWNAVRKVPPGTHLPKPFKKRFLPTITYPEDQLIREFEERQPMLADREVINAANPTESVAWKFVNKQLEHMQAGYTKEQAFRLSERHMIKHGRKFLKGLVVEKEETKQWEFFGDDIHKLPPHELAWEDQVRCMKQIGKSARQDVNRRPPAPGRLAHLVDHRHWKGEGAFDTLQARGHGRGGPLPITAAADEEEWESGSEAEYDGDDTDATGFGEDTDAELMDWDTFDFETSVADEPET